MSNEDQQSPDRHDAAPVGAAPPVAVPIKYPFVGATEATRYRLFPDELENDDYVAFHGTAEANLKAIIDGGFLFTASLQSLSFAKSSSLALKYACEARSDASPNGCVLAVRFSSFDGVVVESSIIHVHRLEKQPTVFGYCIVPADYRFV